MIKKISKKIIAAFLSLSMAMILLLTGFPLQTHAAEADNFANLILLVNFENSSKDSYGVQDIFNEGYSGTYTYFWKKPPAGSYQYTRSSFASYFEGGKMSFKQYLYDISDGALRIHNYVPQENSDGSVATLTLPGSAADYIDNDYLFMSRVIQSMQGENPVIPVDGSQLDYNNDGCVDNLTVLVQAPNEGTFYSHKTNFSDTTATVKGKYFSPYNIISVQSLMSQQSGVIAHEFLHSLGAPDLYRPNGPDGVPVGGWGIMASVGTFLQYPLAYIRSNLGWLNIPEITTSGDYTLNCATAADGNRAFSIRTSLSDTESFIVEYRKKGQSVPTAEYDAKIPESGLIAYRVDNNVNEKTNAGGKNYIYVFRPNTSANHALANETYRDANNIVQNEVMRAAFGTATRPTLGNSDLTKACTENTIFYADGTNSGIVISNVTFSEDGQTASFHVELPQISKDEYWAKYGPSIPLDSSGSIAMTQNESNKRLYIAYQTGEVGSIYLHTAFYNEASKIWEPLGSALFQGGIWEKPVISYSGGTLRLLYVGSDGRLRYTTWNGNSWNADTILPFSNPNDLQFVEGSENGYVSFYTNNTFYVWNPVTNTKIASLAVALAYPRAAYFQNELYVLYSNYGDFNSDNKTTFAKYSPSGWTTLHVADSLAAAKSGSLCVSNGSLYAVATDNSDSVAMITFDGNSWQESTIPGVLGRLTPLLEVKDGIPYVICTDNTTVRVHYRQNGSWKQLSQAVCTDAGNVDTAILGNYLYVGSTSEQYLSVRRYATAVGTSGAMPTPTVTPTPNPPVTPNPGTGATPTPTPTVTPTPGTGTTPVVDSYAVSVTPPSGYTDNTLYIDGVEYPAQNINGQKKVTLRSGTAKTAVMYKYNQRQVPIGMYVWQLTYSDHHYTVTPVPALEDLISYHGFSIRFQGYTGIRFKSGLDSNTKRQLINGNGLNGYKMTECGTLVMLQSNRQSAPFIRGSSKVVQGRAYYTENGVTHNAVLEVVSGRERYASVLTKLPVNRYKTEYAFRGYAVLTCNGQELVIYGPPVSKNMYSIAVQLINSGSYTPGSSSYNFLQKIITDADTQ